MRPPTRTRALRFGAESGLSIAQFQKHAAGAGNLRFRSSVNNTELILIPFVDYGVVFFYQSLHKPDREFDLVNLFRSFIHIHPIFKRLNVKDFAPPSFVRQREFLLEKTLAVR
jgi:hypothetical protein